MEQLNKQTGAVGVLDVVGFGVVGHDSLSLMNVGAPRPQLPSILLLVGDVRYMGKVGGGVP